MLHGSYKRCAPNPFLAGATVNDASTFVGKRMHRGDRSLSLAFTTLKSVLFIYMMSVATVALSQSAPPCLYTLDPSAQGAFSISGTTTVSASCSAVVESSATQAFQMSGTETLSLANSAQVGVVGGWSLSGQSKIVNQSTGQTIQPVKITSPGDPLAFLPAPTQGTIISQSHTSYDMNSRPPNNTLSPGVYCGGLAIGNTNGATFTMNPGTYIMAGGGLTINSLAVVQGVGVTVYNTSSSGWGCSASSSYTPITISGQASVTMSSPTSGALAGVLLFGDRSGCSTVGSCQDQVNGGGSTTFNGAIYLKSDTLVFSGNHSSSGCMLSVADKININGNSSFVINGCGGAIGGVSVSITPTAGTLHGGQSQQFSATVTNASSTAVTWSISPAGVRTISATGLYTAPTTISSQQTVTVKATSQVDPAQSASATITLLPPVPPSITASIAPTPNSQGWNNSNVTVTYTCVAGSSPIQTCPSPVVVSTEGANGSVSGTVTDTSGQTATASVTIKLDKTPPTITAVVTPAPVGGVNFGSATVTFTCTDSLSGVASCPSPITKTTIGAGQVVTGTATDKAGNSSTTSVTLNIQAVVAPTITATLSPAPNAAGWNDSNVTVTFTCTPGSYAIQTCPAPVVVSTEGANQPVSGTVVDASGATASTSVSVNLDKTPPTITAVVTPAPVGGIDFGSATVTFTCTDALSGIATCSSPVTDTTIGAGQVVTGTATDKAGNSSTTSVTLNIQAVVAPTITATLSPAPNAAGWNDSNVTVTFTCTPGSYAIQTCPAPVVVSTEGANQPVSGTVVDASGATANANVSVNLDKTPPTITAVVTPAPVGGVNFGSATVTFTCTDALSGIATCSPPVTDTTIGPNQNITGTATDKAGNTQSTSVTLNIQSTVPPIITAVVSPSPNTNGWNNSNVTVTFTCTPGSYPIQSCQTPVIVSTEGANQTVSGTATDTSGQTATTSISVSLDKTPPIITAVVTPTPTGGVNFGSATVTFTCTDALSGIATCSPPVTDTTIGPNQTITGTATDKAGNTQSTSVTLNIQPLTPPTIAAVATPAPNAAGWNNSDVTVTFTCSPGINAVASCSSPTVVSTEGANQSICGTVVDTSGLSNTACATVNLDKTPPTITALASPAAMNGWNATPVTVTFTCSDSLSGIATCPSPQTVSTNGMGQLVSGTATDVAGNSSSAQTTINIDQIPPSILQFTAPSQLAPGQSGTATVSAADNIGIAEVVIQLNGTAIATLNAPPYTADFTAPANATTGTTLTLTALVTDAAGNTATSIHSIQVVASGVVTGQVLSDVTGLPLAAASVQIVGGGGQDTSDSNGRYSIASNSSHLFLSFNVAANPSTGTPVSVGVEREVFLQNGVGTVPVDARMTPLSPPVSINAAGGSLGGGQLTIAVAAGAVSAATNFYLTPLSQQGLPGLLPLGWSPVTAFDLRADSSTSASFNASFTQLPASLTLHLVQYDSNSHAWIMVTPNLSDSAGTLSVPVPSVGDFALVSADAGNTSIVIPSVGQPLTGVSMVSLPAGATASGSLNPPSISPSGGTSVAALAVQSSIPLPSGTVIQANVQENYSLTSGKQLSSAKRMEDIILYQFAAPSGAAAEAIFPVTPSQTFAPDVFSSGDVHMDIVSGRESIRGQVGGSDAATVSGGDATITIAAGSLPQDTAIAVAPETVETFLPSTASLTPLAEYNIDFSGETLSSPAQLSVAAGSAQAGDNIFVVQIQRVSGVPYLVVVSLAQVSGSSMMTQAVPGLSGITQGGDYIFYKVTSPTGYVSGTITGPSGPLAATVQTDGLPFVAFSSFSGSYVIPALTGTVNVTASVPNTALSGSDQAQVTAGQTSTVNLTLAGQTEAATVTPPNGAVGIPLTAEIDITAPDSFNQASVTAASVMLTSNGQGGGSPIPVRFVFTQNGTRLSVFPVSALQPSTTYTLAASGIANNLGGLISVPSVTFTTQSITPPNFNTNALVFSMPDQNGNVQISAPADSFPAGTTVLIVDQTSGIVLSLTVANDGSVSGQMPGSIDDVLTVTITAPDKTTATFTISKYVAADGTTAIGSGGGTVTGPGNLAMIIPQGALNKGTTFKLDLLDQTAFTQLPTWQNLNFGSGMQITAPAMPSFNKEVKLAFPVPADAPQGASYYVFRILTDQNNNVLFETIDQAFVQGSGANAQVVTASPPFCGYMNSYGNFLETAAATFSVIASATVQTFMMWDFDPNQPGVSSAGLITGKIFQSSNQGDISFSTLQAPVAIALTNKPQYVTTSDPKCGGYSLFDPQFGGGTRSITATYQPNQRNTQTIVASTVEVNGAQSNDASFSITAGLEALYKNIGRLNFTFAAPTPPPPPPQISIGIFDANTGHPVSGIVQTGASLNITFSSNLSIQSASINGAPCDGVACPSLASATPPPNAAPNTNYYQLSAPYQPSDPGPYSISASGIDPLNSASAITVTQGFLAVAAGGTNNTPTQNPPIIISSIPTNAAKNVSQQILPVVTFSEPVTNVLPGNITLVGGNSGNMRINLIGVKTDGTIADPVGPTDSITSLTIQPTSGLEFGDTYTLTFNGIVDANGRPLSQPTTIVFSTFDPLQLGSASSTVSVQTRPVVIGNYAYLGALVNDVTSGPDVINITDPSNPIDLGVAETFIGRVTDITGQANSPVTGGTGGLLALSAGTAQDVAIPANIWLYSISQQDPTKLTRVGAVSATSSATQAGVPVHLSMKDQFLYASTFLQGLQVIDLEQAAAEYQQVFGTNPSQFGEAVSTEGDGFAMDTIVNTIPLPLGQGTATEFGLKAADFATNGASGTAATQTLLVATGQLPLVVADPLAGTNGVLYPPSDSTGSLTKAPVQMTEGTTVYSLINGEAVDVGTIPVIENGITVNKTIAVLVGSGTVNGIGEPLLAVVDISQPYVPNSQAPFALGTPYLPQPVGFFQLSANPTDVILDGTLALVGTGSNVLIVDLTDPTNPINGGQIKGSFGNRLALDSNGVLIAAGNIPATSVQTATFGSPCATYRAKLQKNPPKTDSIPINPSGKLAWMMSAGVSMSSPVTNTVLNQDGLILTNVKLGRRQLAKMMSLPYILLQRSNDPSSSDPHNWPRCTLSASSDTACSGLGSHYSGRSRLFSFNVTTLSTSVTVQAEYLIDQLDGDADKNPNLPDSCLLLTQSYQFTQEGLTPFEPNGKLATARFLPTIHYQYSTTDGGPQLVSLTTPQRFEFDARSNLPVPNVPTEAKAPANATLLSCDHDFSTPLTPSPIPSCHITPDLVGIFGGGSDNPLNTEQYQTIIQGGKEVLASPGSPNAPTIIDNLHWGPEPDNSDSRNQPIELPSLGLPGCPACIHVHWRWSNVLEPEGIPGFFQALFGIPVDPNFDNNNGLPFIPVGSTQDVSIAIEASGTEHPAATTLVSDLPTGKSILPSNLTQSPTFWYVSTGHQGSDTFFLHGGAFSSIYANSSFYPSAGPLTINVEHSHDVNYVIQVQYQLPSAGAPGPTLSPITQVSGTLTGTADNIVISGSNLSSLVPFGFSNPFLITVKLTDQLTGATTTSNFGYSQPDTVPQVP